MSDSRTVNKNAIFSLWLNWAMSLGMLTMPMVFALFTAKIWIPLVTFAMMGILILYDNSGKMNKPSACNLLPQIAIRSLAISGFIMMIICIGYARGIIDYFYDHDLLNNHIPFISILIIAPVTFFITLWARIRGNRSSICRHCVIRYGTSAERGFIGKLFSQESKAQATFLLSISGALSVVEWAYYAAFYINVNFNSPDKFMFIWVPIILYGLSLIYAGMRSFSLWGYYYQNIEGSTHRQGASSCIRYLVICNESIFLNKSDDYYDIPDQNKYDSPAMILLKYNNNMSLKQARDHFVEISDISPDDFSFRFMYYNDDSSGICNFYHYICCANSKEIVEKSQLPGKWYSMSQLQRLLYNHDLSPMLASEIHRLYMVTMAWKTYDAEGKRLYKIKNYRPMFRLNGICDWDVDFNNPLWLQVSAFNQDKPFYNIRRFWRKHTAKK